MRMGECDKLPAVFNTKYVNIPAACTERACCLWRSLAAFALASFLLSVISLCYVGSIFFSPLLFLSSAPLAHILHYDKLDDPTGITQEGEAGPPPAVHACDVFIASGFSTSTLVNSEVKVVVAAGKVCPK